MYAPVATRFQTYDVKLDRTSEAYCEHMLAWPDLREWWAAAQREPEQIEELDIEFCSEFCPAAVVTGSSDLRGCRCSRSPRLRRELRGLPGFRRRHIRGAGLESTVLEIRRANHLQVFHVRGIIEQVVLDPGRWCTQSPAETRCSSSSYMNFAQPFSMITMWNSATCRCQPVPFSGASLAFTSWAITRPPVAAATPRSR